MSTPLLSPAGPADVEGAGRGVPFVRAIARYGNRPALVDPDGSTLSYIELAGRVGEVAERIGPIRRLVLVTGSNTVDAVVAYLAALHGGHPVLLATDHQHHEALVARYDPDVVAGDGSAVDERRAGTAHRLHPDLALLLSTSGSTGSAKLVRLSHDNVQANATAIGDYLDIRNTDRAVLSLPIHYCYGLSVLNSNLARGAAVLLTDRSVVEPEFWAMFREHGGTSLHGVPYTFDLLDRVGFGRMSLPSLRYVTQAGGRLAPEQVGRYARLAERGGWRFFVMYGQTEATARMAYLPPELALTHPTTIGVPIPGGAFEIRPTGDAPDAGELVYRGPNVMLGYAERPADLALGRTVDVLATGDLGRRRPDGSYEVTGRANRFCKLFGHRVDLDHVECLLREHGHDAACTGTEDTLVVAVTGHDARSARNLLATHLPVPRRHILVQPVTELPRLGNGKIDYPALARLPGARREGPSAGSVRQVFATAFPGAPITGDDTFVDLGGDSLSYVAVSLDLERLIGRVPPSWPTTPVRDLEALRPRHRRLPRVETTIVLRAVAITLVAANHIGAFHLLGGAHLMLAVSGWTFARFALAPAGPAARRILRGAARIAIPAMLWIGYRVLVSDDVGWDNLLLVNSYLHRSPAAGYWYIEVLVQILLVLGAAAAIPAVRRFERRRPFAAAAVVLALALAANQFAQDRDDFPEQFYTAHGAAWLFVLGWLAHRAVTRTRRLAVLALVLLLVPGYFTNLTRDTIVTAGLLAIVLLPTIALPRPAARVAGLLASASLAIYLTHYAIYPALLPHLPPPVVLLVCLAAGTGAWAAGPALLTQIRPRGATARPRWPSRDTANRYRLPRSPMSSPAEPEGTAQPVDHLNGDDTWADGTSK
ncbi:AMP-dependent synthetase and ligase [Frankia canadensis]|uniref:AMP-dependent synthetase and ligase n=1 Tax=Frankia canadensis TaxID=1836972 RepID=A0A2I2KQ34_9ACTN|nr:AMP-binding protein [Frankia canadensis]SNQ47772.1 AMP-dependent synthetase and ligase [Frankia canadensis]SOU55062.1 AMP-dependent synthetase and ligase [Frankia canadensis]